MEFKILSSSDTGVWQKSDDTPHSQRLNGVLLTLATEFKIMYTVHCAHMGTRKDELEHSLRQLLHDLHECVCIFILHVYNDVASGTHAARSLLSSQHDGGIGLWI